MLKVLIADDEMLVRVGVKSTIEWEKYGFSVIAEACNGEDALEKIDCFHPDILLTDIRMPKMDGLELLEEIQKRGLPVETIIMSCYNEFELVRSALQHGASDYLLKLSLTPEELIEVLERVKKKILSRQNVSGSVSLFRSNDIYDKLRHSLWDSSIDLNQLNEFALAAGLQLSFDHAALILLTLDSAFNASILSYPEKDTQTLTMAHNLLRDYLLNQKLGDLIDLKQESCHFLVVLRPDIDVSGIAETIKKKIQDYFQTDCSIGVLLPDTYEAEGLTRLNQRLNELIDFRFLHGRGKILTFTKENNSTPDANPKKMSAKSFISHIHGSADLVKLPAAIYKMTEQMYSQKMPRTNCLQLFVSAFYQISALFSIYGGSESELYDFCGQNLVESLNQLQFLADAKTWFSEFSTLASAYLTECGKQQKSREILTVIDYAQTNLHLPISLQDAAFHIGISSAYLSTRFKKETGQSFTEFLTELRMNRAKELLENKSIYIYEICEQIGYTDPNYFCKVFKKYTGLSPEAYRKKRSPAS